MVDAFQPSLPSYDGGEFIQSDGCLNESLKTGARHNDNLSIECLFTLALQPTKAGCAALSFLFDLYTGKEVSSNVLKEALGKDSLVLYEKIAARNARYPQDERWPIPAKLLLMAGFETESHSQLRSDIVDRLNMQYALPELADSTTGKIGPALFDTNRYVTGAELDAVSATLNHQDSSLKFLPAHLWPNNHQQYTELIDWIKRHNLPGVTGIFVPLLAREEHWILLGVYASDGQAQPVIFDSLCHIDQAETERLNAFAHTYGTQPPRLKQADLQGESAPNTCGVHMMNAMLAIASHPGNPEEALDTVISHFNQFDEQEKAFEMQRGRAALLGAAIDGSSVSSPPP